MRGLSYARLGWGYSEFPPTSSKEEGIKRRSRALERRGYKRWSLLLLAGMRWLSDTGGTLSCRLLQTKQSVCAAARAESLGKRPGGPIQIISLIQHLHHRHSPALAGGEALSHFLSFSSSIERYSSTKTPAHKMPSLKAALC
ncbi:hypothetical protein XELAEV_18008008mg [Xenopus laevis]|uniref:Uncharacterized protein n=1 Tax=Xenopus laevis TaxID=8355 RepID=A0A974E419_XENLA|nr:hypothetical protein XELAEV_18008008mg [Xenopus laevis]